MSQAVLVSKSERAYDWIKRRINTQEFTPGYRLVLGSIAKDLDMSVVPVREAIRQLEAEGIVTYEHNVGARVSMVNVSQYRDSMQTLSFIEAAATALAAPHVTISNVRAAKDINKKMASELEHLNPGAFTTLNREFHFMLFQHCPNARLLKLVKAEWSRLGYLRNSTFAFVPERARASVREHDHIINLVENAAPLGEIEMAVRQHSSTTLTAFMSHEYPDEAAGLINF